MANFRAASAEYRAASFNAYSGDVRQMQASMRDARRTTEAWTSRDGSMLDRATREYDFANESYERGGDYLPTMVISDKDGEAVSTAEEFVRMMEKGDIDINGTGREGNPMSNGSKPGRPPKSVVQQEMERRRK